MIQNAGRTLVLGLLVATLILSGCTALPVEDPSEPNSRPDYGPTVANYVRYAFKEIAKAPNSKYDNFGISGLRCQRFLPLRV